MKIKCKHCGSTNVTYSRENVNNCAIAIECRDCEEGDWLMFSDFKLGKSEFFELISENIDRKIIKTVLINGKNRKEVLTKLKDLGCVWIMNDEDWDIDMYLPLCYGVINIYDDKTLTHEGNRFVTVEDFLKEDNNETK